MHGQRGHPPETLDFDAFFRANRVVLERYVLMRVSQVDEAMDIVAESLCQLLEYCRRAEQPIRSHRAVLFQIARRRIVDYYAARSERMRDVPIDEAPPIADRRSVAAAAIADEEVALVRRALATLREEHRDIVTLHAIVGLEYAEIAELLGVSQGVVRVRLHRARRALRQALEGMQSSSRSGAADDRTAHE